MLASIPRRENFCACGTRWLGIYCVAVKGVWDFVVPTSMPRLLIWTPLSIQLPWSEGLLGHPPPTSVFVDETMAFFALLSACPDWQSLNDIHVPLCQCFLSAAIDNFVFKSLLSSAPSIRSCALVLSSRLPLAHDLLNVIPSPSLGLHLQDCEFHSCLSYWLGVPLHNDHFVCPECHNTADPFGDHQVGCGGNGNRISRHNAIKDIIFSAAQSAALEPSNETPGLVSQSSSHPLMSSAQTGSMAIQLPWTCMLSPLSSLSPYQKLHSPKVTLFKSEFSSRSL